MNIFSIIVLAILAIGLIWGYCAKFSRSLRFLTTGIFGIIISVVVCWLVGGILLNISFIGDAFGGINDSIAQSHQIFETIKVGTILFYVCLFIVLQIIRVIILKLIVLLFEMDNAFMRYINRIFGALFIALIFAALIMVFFAVVKHFQDQSWLSGVISSINDSWFDKIYQNNIIAF